MKNPDNVFLIFSLAFALLAVFFPAANDVQQGQAIGGALFCAGIGFAGKEGKRIANKR